MFTKDDVPDTTTQIMVAVSENGMNGAEKLHMQEDIKCRLEMWNLPKLGQHELVLDAALLRLSPNFPNLFKCFPYLDAEMMKALLPLRGEFANYGELAQAHADSYKRTEKLTRDRMRVELSSMKVNEASGKLERITERADAVVSGIWQLAGFSEPFKYLKDMKLLENGRPLTLIEAFSWLLAHNDHPYFSKLTEDEHGDERMEVHRGIYLAGSTIEIPKGVTKYNEVERKEVLKYGAYLVRATRRDMKTGRYGWLLQPLYASFLEHVKGAPIPLVTICTPVAKKS